MYKPRIFIAMASGILGGPGKGLEQFLRFGGLEGAAPLLIDYVTGKEKGETEFVQVMKRTGVAMASLYQHKTLDFNLVPQALELIKKHHIEVLQSHGYKSHMLCALLHRKTHLPWIGFVHGWTQENMRMEVYKALEQVLLLGATEVVAVSESLRSRLIKPVRRKALVIPNALAPAELSPTRTRAEVRAELGLTEDTLAVGLVGRLSPEKGHKVLLHAMAKLRGRKQKLHALLVGAGQEEAPLRALATELGLAKACSFVGHVRHTADYYQAMDIQVMPSTTEGMPNAALEGMYMGLPLIASRVGGIPEVLVHEETGLLYTSGDQGAFEDALGHLSTCPHLRASMGGAGKARVQEHFNPQTRAKRILDLYHKVLHP